MERRRLARVAERKRAEVVSRYHRYKALESMFRRGVPAKGGVPLKPTVAVAVYLPRKAHLRLLQEQIDTGLTQSELICLALAEKYR